MGFEIPTVTLEDLQAFHAKHFPANPPHAVTSQPTEYEKTGEDDLGYYPDGVKRTLTDEQIEIFRHSEIHALIRARELERDNAEYEARRDIPEKSQEHPLTEEKVPHAASSRKAKRSAEHMDGTALNYEGNDQKLEAQTPSGLYSRKIISYDD
ncbi:hypothetical protein N7493_004500 [Penicillium malachiteum]|uniref:Uncharacterized protein n=1 Tax=Penicillium malachiteum TaxID=1324776 RepID=A0AAD6HNP7_9EURO|nr:hypothetical protein N7493_004500 [Penicillium malachiteum]